MGAIVAISATVVVLALAASAGSGDRDYIDELFRSPLTADDDLPDLIRAAADVVRHDPALAKSVSPQEALGLYYRLVWRQNEFLTIKGEPVWDLPELLDVLVQDFGLSILDGLPPYFSAGTGQSRRKIDFVPDLPINVSFPQVPALVAVPEQPEKAKKAAKQQRLAKKFGKAIFGFGRSKPRDILPQEDDPEGGDFAIEELKFSDPQTPEEESPPRDLIYLTTSYDEEDLPSDGSEESEADPDLPTLLTLYSWPYFNQIPPQGLLSVQLLGRHFPQQFHPLANPELVLALRKKGICFTLTAFMGCVRPDPESIPRLIPLLHSYGITDFLHLMSTMIRFGHQGNDTNHLHLHVVLAMLDSPPYAQLVRQARYRRLYARALYDLIERNVTGYDTVAHCVLVFFNRLVRHPSFAAIVNQPAFGDDIGSTLLSKACQQGRYDLALVLFRSEALNLGVRQLMIVLRSVKECCSDEDLRLLLQSVVFRQRVAAHPAVLAKVLRNLVEMGESHALRMLWQYGWISNSVVVNLVQFASQSATFTVTVTEAFGLSHSVPSLP